MDREESLHFSKQEFAYSFNDMKRFFYGMKHDLQSVLGINNLARVFNFTLLSVNFSFWDKSCLHP